MSLREPREERECRASLVAALERHRPGSRPVEQVHARFLRAYGRLMGAREQTAQPEHVPVFEREFRSVEEVNQAERVRGSRLERMVFALAPQDYALRLIAGREVFRHTWRGETECTPNRYGEMGVRGPHSWIVVPESASEATVFHEYCHLFTADEYWAWKATFPLGHAFMEAHTEHLTRRALGARGADYDTTVLEMWNISDEIHANAMFGGAIAPLERAMMDASGMPDSAAAVRAWANIGRGEEVSWDHQGEAPRGSGAIE